MRRHQLSALAQIMIWIGSLEIIASFLAKFWFQCQVHWTPVFFLILVAGVLLYIAVRIL